MLNNYYLNYKTTDYFSILNGTATISILIINHINLLISASISYILLPTPLTNKIPIIEPNILINRTIYYYQLLWPT